MSGSSGYFADLLGEFTSAGADSTPPERAAGKIPARSQSAPRVTLRLTEDENRQLRRLAAGMTISAYIRQCIFGDKAAKRTRKNYAPIQDHTELARLLAMLGETRLANNLNQLAHQANCGNLQVDESVLERLEETYGHVISMRDTLIRTLGLLEDA